MFILLRITLTVSSGLVTRVPLAKQELNPSPVIPECSLSVRDVIVLSLTCPTLAVPGLLLHVHHALSPGGAHGIDLGAVEQVPVTSLVIGWERDYFILISECWWTNLGHRSIHTWSRWGYSRTASSCWSCRWRRSCRRCPSSRELPGWRECTCCWAPRDIPCKTFYILHALYILTFLDLGFWHHFCMGYPHCFPPLIHLKYSVLMTHFFSLTSHLPQVFPASGS